MDNQNIKIRLKAFDHSILDKSSIEIVDTAPIATSFPDFHRVATRSGFELERISYPYNV